MVVTTTHLSDVQDAVAARPAYSGLAHAALTCSLTFFTSSATSTCAHDDLPLAYVRFDSPAACYVFSIVRDELSQGALLSDPFVSDTWSQGT